MRVLLDECVPRALGRELLGHQVRTVAEAGWAGVTNGELLKLAAKQFDLLLTVDRSLEYQQNFAGVALAVIVIHAPSNDLAVLRPLMPSVLAAMSECKRGTVHAYPRFVTKASGQKDDRRAATTTVTMLESSIVEVK